MNLERVEEICINHLSQVPNPLAPIEKLLKLCRNDAACGALGEQELLAFLRAHALIHLVEGIGPGAVLDADLAAMTGAVGAKAILKTRVPTDRSLAQMMGEQAGAMTAALRAMSEDLGEDADAGQAGRIAEALARAEALRGRIAQLGQD